MINIIALVLGLIALVYGIRQKLKLWIVVGLILFGCGAVSAYVDYKFAGVEDAANPNEHVPSAIGYFLN